MINQSGPLRVILSCLLAVVSVETPLHAIDVQAPEGVCVDPRGCDISDGGGSDTSYTQPINIQPGKMTKRVWNNIKNKSFAPIDVLASPIALTMALMMDSPAFLFKGVVNGLYYGGKGLYYGARGVGRGFGKVASAPFKKRKARSQFLAYTTAASCSGQSGGGFDAYRSWEDCKRAVLKRQKALTKVNPGNKDNEKWCKAHLPLSSGPNRMSWEARCNPGGGETLVSEPQNAPAVEPQNALAVPAPTGAKAAEAPALEAGPNPSAAATAQERSAAAADQAADIAQALSSETNSVEAGDVVAGGTPQDTLPLTEFDNRAPARATDAAQAAPQLDTQGEKPAAAAGAPNSPAPDPVRTQGAKRGAPPAGTSVPVQTPPEPASAGARTMPSVGTFSSAKTVSSKQALAATRKAADCALKPFFDQAQDSALTTSVRAELAGIFKELAAAPASGKIQSQRVYTLSRDQMTGDKQIILSLSLQRVESSGEIHIDSQYSIQRGASSAQEGQNIVYVAAAGDVLTQEVEPSAAACLK